MLDASRRAKQGAARAFHTLSMAVWARHAARREFPEGWGVEQLDARLQQLSTLAAMACASHGVHIDVHGPRPPAPCIIVSNHSTYFDPLVLCATAPSAAIAKREVGSWPFVGDMLNRLGTLMVDRDNPHSGAVVLRRSMRVLAAGHRVLGFPEGTTSVWDRVLPLRRGLFGLAQVAGVPIVAAAVRYDDRKIAWTGGARFAPHYARMVAKTRIEATVRFGPARQPPSKSPAAWAEATRQEIAAMLNA